jgi:hypothetical protein
VNENVSRVREPAALRGQTRTAIDRSLRERRDSNPATSGVKGPAITKRCRPACYPSPQRHGHVEPPGARLAGVVARVLSW